MYAFKSDRIHLYLVHYNYFTNIYRMKLCKIYSTYIKEIPVSMLFN